MSHHPGPDHAERTRSQAALPLDELDPPDDDDPEELDDELDDPEPDPDDAGADEDPFEDDPFEDDEPLVAAAGVFESEELLEESDPPEELDDVDEEPSEPPLPLVRESVR